MIWKKTWFSYGVWGLYSAVVSMAFALGIMLFVPKGSNPYLAVLLVCLFFLLMTLFFFLSQTIVVNVGGKRKIKRKAAVLVETFAILAALAGGSVLSVGFLRQAQPETLLQSEYLAGSFVGGPLTVSESVYGARVFYPYVLRALFIFVGNHGVAALWLQLFLFLAGSFLLYRGVRRLSGKAAGVFVFAVLMTVPLWVGTKETIAPLWLEFFLFGMGFYLTAVFLGKHRDLEFAGERGKGRKFFDCIRPVLLGLFTAFVIYAGPFGILLTALGLSVLWSLPEGGKTRTYPSRLLLAFLLLAGIAGGLFLLCLVEACVCKETLFQVAETKWQLYGAQVGLHFPLTFTDRESVAFSVLAGGMFWGIFRFFFEPMEDSLSGMFFFFLAAAGVRTAGLFTPDEKEIWLLLVMAVCGAVCIGRSLMPFNVSKPEKTAENPGYEEKKEAAKEESAGEQRIIKEKAPQPQKKQEMQDKPERAEKPAVKYLDNPLPGPKKHVPKTMDYDITISDDDDFDF